MQVTKKRFDKKKLKNKDSVHREGNFYCDCCVRNYRKWLGVKLYGHAERTSPEDHIVEANKMVCDVPNCTNT